MMPRHGQGKGLCGRWGANMIISAAPFRVSFAGGGSDVPVYYRQRRGAVLSATINKHVYVSIHPYFTQGKTLLKYSENELVDRVDTIRHRVFREALRDLLPNGGVEIVSTADIPSRSGLGSSSTFCVALYNALFAYTGVFASREKLARKACELEMQRLGEPIGKQDQYAAAYGGMNLIEFHPNEAVSVTPLNLPGETVGRLEANLMLLYTGDQRSAGEILSQQNRAVQTEPEAAARLDALVTLAYGMRDDLVAGDLEAFANKLHEAWIAKRGLCSVVTTERIDDLYAKALQAGAIGGKLLGAGGGGFLLLYCEPARREAVRQALPGCFELPFRFEWNGARIIYVGERHTREGFVY